MGEAAGVVKLGSLSDHIDDFIFYVLHAGFIPIEVVYTFLGHHSFLELRCI